MLLFARFRLLLLATPALMLGGCVAGDFADGIDTGYGPSAYGDKKPGGDGYDDPYWIGASGDYDWIDRADNLARAIGRAAPDFTFRVGDSPIWAWQARNGELLLVEPKGGDVLQYFFAPDGQLYLTRSAERSYGYDRGVETVSYDRAGRLDRGRGWGGDEAGDLFARGQQLFSAYRDFRRFGRGGYAANRAYGYNGGYGAWGSTILIAPYAPSLDSGWGRGWQPRWRSRPDWDDWRRSHPARDHDHWGGDDRRAPPDAGGLINRDGPRPDSPRPDAVTGRRPDGNGGPAGGWIGRGQGGRQPGAPPPPAADGSAAFDPPPPGAPAFRRDPGRAGGLRGDEGARDMRGGDSWSGTVVDGDRRPPARTPRPPRPPIAADAPVAIAPSADTPPADAMINVEGDVPPPPARAPRDRAGFDSPVADRPVERVPLPASEAPAPRYDPPPRDEPAPPPLAAAPPPPEPRDEPAPPPPPPPREPRQAGPISPASVATDGDDSTRLRPD